MKSQRPTIAGGKNVASANKAFVVCNRRVPCVAIHQVACALQTRSVRVVVHWPTNSKIHSGLMSAIPRALKVRVTAGGKSRSLTGAGIMTHEEMLTAMEQEVADISKSPEWRGMAKFSIDQRAHPRDVVHYFLR